MGSGTFHIRRDGGFLCGKERDKSIGNFYKKDSFIKFSDAHSTDLTLKNNICKECLKRYFEILDKMKDPIIVRKEIISRRKQKPGIVKICTSCKKPLSTTRNCNCIIHI